MISITKNLRSAAIVAAAIAALAATSALAQNLSSPGASHSPQSKASSAPKATPSHEPVNGPKSDAKPDEQTEKADVDKPDAAAHGACVSDVARSNATADNGHSHSNHGGAVRAAAHDCL